MQSRDEIAEQIIEQAGSIGPERVEQIRMLVTKARREGVIRDYARGGIVVSPSIAILGEPPGVHVNHIPKSTAGSDGARHGQPPGGELPVERRATSGPVVPLEERGRVDEPFEPWARRQIEKLAAILLPLESSMSKMRERVYEIVREEIALVRGGEDPHAETKRTGEGREVDARGHSNVAEPTATQPDNSRPAGNASSAVVDEGSAASRQAAPSPDPIPAWMLSAEEIADLAPVEHPTGTAAWWRYFSVALRTSIARRAPKLPTPEDVAAPIRAALEASRSPSHELVEAADAMRDTLGKPWEFNHGHSNKPPEECPVCQAFRAYDAARSRHASGAQPDSACDESGWLVEITGPKYWTGTPGCGNWTADSLAAMRFARRQDAEAACRHLAPSGAIPVEHAWVSHRPAGAQPSGPDRCEVCDWPLAESREKGCVPGDCSYRPEQGSDEWHRIRARREALKAQPSGAPAPASAQGEIAKSAPNERTHSMSDAGDACGCRACNPSLVGVRMIWCETCGNKRCPHANDHRNTCTNSNEPGQPGSAYPAWKPASAQGEVCEKPDAASPVKPCPDVPFGSLGNDVEETLDALLGFGRSARMVERAQLRNEIAGLLARRTPAPSPATGESASPPSEQTAKELDELLAVFAKGDGDDEDCWTQPARRAQLYVASLRAEVERLEKRVTNLLSGTVESFEDGTLTILPHREMTTRIASALAGILDECEAPNYVQMILSRAGEPGEPRKRYVVTVQRPEGKTPHQLREDAEKERDAIRQEVERMRTEHARLVAVINDDGSLENIDDIVSIAEDAMHAYNVQSKLIEEVERLRALMKTIRSNDRSEKYEIGEPRRDGETPISGARFQTPREIVDMEEQRAANALRTALGAQDSKEERA